MDDKNKPPKKRRIEMIEDDSKKPTPNNNKNNINSNGIDKREMIRRMQNESQNQINRNDNRPLNSKKRSSEVPPTYEKPNNKQLIKRSVKSNNKISIFNKFNFEKILLNKRFLVVFITLFIVSCSLLFLILDKNDNHNPIKTDNTELTNKKNKNLEKEINKVLKEHNLGTVIQAIPLSENKNLVLATDSNLYSESKKSNFGKRILIVDKGEEIEILQESANQLRIFYFNQEETFSVKPKGFNSPVFITYDFLVVKDRKGNDVEVKGFGNVYQFNNKEKVDLLSTTKGVFERAVYKNNQLGIVEKEYKDNENIYPTYLKPHDLVLYLWNPSTEKFKENEREYKDPNSTKNES